MATTLKNDPLQGLADLLQSGDFNADFVAPTEHAAQLARGLVSSVYKECPHLRALWPAFSTMGDGSLYVRWKQGEREVRVLVPPATGIPVRAYDNGPGEP